MPVDTPSPLVLCESCRESVSQWLRQDERTLEAKAAQSLKRRAYPAFAECKLLASHVRRLRRALVPVNGTTNSTDAIAESVAETQNGHQAEEVSS